VLIETVSWVQAIIADYAICPFTLNAFEAGIPKGNVGYIVSNATTIDEAYRDYFVESSKMFSADLVDVATILLVYPNVRCFDDIDCFLGFARTLDVLASNETSCGIMFELFNEVDNVYFHPDFVFEDKDEQVIFLFDENNEIIGTSDEVISPINYARRSPYPVINVLRSSQVKNLQKNIPSGKIFYGNKEKLDKIGSAVLQEMLDRRDWSGLNLHNRKVKMDKTKFIDKVNAEFIKSCENAAKSIERSDVREEIVKEDVSSQTSASEEDALLNLAEAWLHG
jgi:hypothetical protein